MLIGIDAACWANARGYGRFARELLGRMVESAPNDHFLFYLDPASSRTFDLEGPNIERVQVQQSASPSEAASADGARSPVDMLRFTRAVRRSKPDVVFFPSVYTYFPVPFGTCAVVGIHDAIAERFPSLTLPSARARLFWKAKVRLAVLQSTLVLSVSEFAADDVSRVIGVPRSKIRVALEAPAKTFLPSESAARPNEVAARFGLGPEDRWFTYVGGFNPHKNVELLVRAFAEATSDLDAEPRPFLLLVGNAGSDVFHQSVEGIRRAVEEEQVGDRVIWCGFVPDEELRHLHSGSLALVLPSDCEGFGLPAVEAAACGAAVIATTESPLPEILAGGGIFVAPRDEEALTEALRTMVHDPETRRDMAVRALHQASQLSWERCAAQVMAALREAVEAAEG